MFYEDGLNVIDSRSLEQYYAFFPSTIRQMQALGVMGNVVLNDGKCSCSQSCRSNPFNNEYAIICHYLLRQEQQIKQKGKSAS